MKKFYNIGLQNFLFVTDALESKVYLVVKAYQGQALELICFECQ